MIEAIVVGAIVLGLVQAIKKTNGINERYIPLVAIFVGIVISGIATVGGSDFILNGIVYGLSGVGLYEVSVDKLK